MFISVEKAVELTGKSKNVLYRLMAKGHIHFVRCTKGKRFLEVAELRRVFGTQLQEPVDPDTLVSNLADSDLYQLIEQMQRSLAALNDKVDKQNQLFKQLTANGLAPALPNSTTQTAPAKVAAPSPEKDPEWPPFITCYADLAKRDEIKARYER